MPVCTHASCAGGLVRCRECYHVEEELAGEAHRREDRAADGHPDGLRDAAAPAEEGRRLTVGRRDPLRHPGYSMDIGRPASGRRMARTCNTSSRGG